MTDEYVHPAFLRARSLSEPLRSHFPKSQEEARDWEPMQRSHALSHNVLIVAQTRITCQWAAYCAAVPGMDHTQETDPVLALGTKVAEKIARVLFPEFKDVPYAD